MKKVLIILIMFFVSASLSAQKTWTSVQSGNWNQSSTWQTSGGASGAPDKTVKSTDRVIITAGHTVTSTEDLIFEENSRLDITNGGKLKMGNSSNPATTFTMKSDGNKFYMANGFYEGNGSGGNMLIEKGLIDWRDSDMYVSGNYNFKSDVDNVTMINMCIRVAQNILFEGVGSGSSYATMTNVSHISGISGTGNLTIKDNSYINATNIKLNASSNTSNLELFSSTIIGSIYSVNGKQKISVSSMSGNASINYWCAGTLDPNLNAFSGPKVNDCTIAQEVCTGPPSNNTDVGVVKTASANSVNAGSSVTYTIVVTNNGPSSAQNVTVTDNLPAELTVTSFNASTGTWNAPTWNIGNLNSGVSVTLSITATVSNSYQGNLINTANVSTTTTDTNPNNNSSSVSVNVNQLNGPTANDDNATTPINTPVNINVLQNDVAGDAALDPTSVTFVNGTQPNPTTEGIFTVNSVTGLVTFSPANNYTGTVTIDYQVCDLNGLCDIATITVVITPAIVGPTANDDNATTPINTPVNINILQNDVAGDAALDPTSVTFINGTEPNPTTEGIFTVSSVTGLVTFIPANNFTGTVTIKYQVCDLNGLCDIATITVVITPAIVGPTANDDSATTLINTPVDITVLVNDVAGSAALDPTTVTFIPGTEPDPSTQGVFTVNPLTGLVTFTPVNGFTGTVTINYKVCDLNELCDIATITVNIILGTGNLYPALGPGTLAFEDLWPGKGDYDFNDLVIDYQFEIISNTSNFVEKVTATFVIRAFGASFENGFGFQLSGAVNAADLNVTGFDLTENFISLAANGTEAGQSKPTIIVFDNAFAQMPHPGIGIGVNTEPNAPYVQPVTLTVNIDFKPNTYTINQLDISNFNPFLIVNKNRSHEVHLPNNPPTDLVDMSLFGQWEDASNPATGKYYVTANNLPWAINIYESFDYPIEKQEILWAHLKFAEWAISGGVQFPDWYKNLTGYRNNSLIYQVPAK
jgi:LruC domain-containing protein